MSYWTYVMGVLEVDSYADTTPMADYITRTVLDHLPKVTGSEGNMRCYVMIPDGHNVSSSHNELGVPAFSSWDLFNIQTERLIVLSGALRDRYFEETLMETNKFLNRLAKRITVNNLCVQLTGFDSRCKRYRCQIFNNHDAYSDMFERKDDEKRWTDYLWPELEPGTRYPKRLLDKEELDYYKKLKDTRHWKEKQEFFALLKNAEV